MLSPRFVGIRTFMRLPYLPLARDADVMVVGIPFDTGTTFRTGTRFGPSSVANLEQLLAAARGQR